jgi:hypothetical protein
MDSRFQVSRGILMCILSSEVRQDHKVLVGRDQ